MAQREFIAGPNFSGRSRALIAALRERAAPSFYIGPYAEAALSGLSSTVVDEIELYRAKTLSAPGRDFPALDIANAPWRQPQSLSGGEQVLLALHCFAVSAFQHLAIDTALEQLDPTNRARAIAYLVGGGFDISLIDNRMAPPPKWHCISRPATATPDFACQWQPLLDGIVPVIAPEIAIRQLSFNYRSGPPIFRDIDVTLTPGVAYRLHGRNGAGKTTLLKILVGVLAPTAGWLTRDGEAYAPWNDGNRALVLAMQNPDHQWCGATLREDISRRRMAQSHYGATVVAEQRVTAIAELLGVPSLDAHLYELPLAARKRLSWLWPFAGAQPWIMFDEPTIGQDEATRIQLAAALAWLCTAGYGVIFVTHDDDFAACVPHCLLHLADGTITSSEVPSATSRG